MDVTALLNSAATAAHVGRKESIEQATTPSSLGGTTVCSTAIPTPSPDKTPSRRSSESRTPNRSRTPWDAGGYSLPLLDTKIRHASSTTKLIYYDESPIDHTGSASPSSPKHKFSDSHSSLSSCTFSSSNNSVSHSRISSLSTVSELQPLSTLAIDMPSPDGRKMSEPHGQGLACPALGEIQPPSPTPRRLTHEITSDVNNQEKHPKEVNRPHSPSDAVLMKWRPSATPGSRSAQERRTPNPSSFLLPEPSSSSWHTRGHKRAVSAPDFAPLNSASSNPAFVPKFGPMPEPTPPLSPTAAGADQLALTMDPAPPSPAASYLFGPDELKCMFVDNCDTDAPLRKAISHIFGRNKLCTRLIPPAVWVHWCRKHYQRCRYRNPAEYATRQADMVSVQIDRVQMWSDENKSRKLPGIVLSWVIQPRKREAQRLSEQDGDENVAQQIGNQGDDQAIANGTAIPNWLLQQCEKEFTTTQVQDVVRRIQTEMQAGYLQQIPDIEILPNISTEGGNTTKPKSTLKRKMGGTPTHKRSQSMRVGGRPMAHPMTRRASHQGSYYDQNHQTFSPAEKRQCVGPLPLSGYYAPQHGFPPVPPRSTERIVPQMHSQFAFAHPPTLETQPEISQHYAYQGPNPSVPTAYHSQGMVPYEANEMKSNRAQLTLTPMYNKVHHRSQSEMVVGHQLTAGQSGVNFNQYDGNRPTSSSSYAAQPPISNFQFTAGAQPGHGLAYESNMHGYYDQAQAVRNWPGDVANHFHPVHPSYATQHGHGRRQSTPVTYRPYPIQRAASAAMLSGTTASEALPPLHTLTQPGSYFQAGHEQVGAQGAEDHKDSQRPDELRH